MVAATTADDAIWLVPYTAPSLPISTRVIHGTLFIATLEALVCACIGIASSLKWAVITNDDGKWDEEVVLGSIGAGICWTIAIGLYIKKWLKRRRRSREAQRNTMPTSNMYIKYGAVDSFDEDDTHPSNSEVVIVEVEVEEDEDKISDKPSPLTVITFTTLGALDEVSYFPSLLLGKIFTPFDLCLGTFFAACMILFIVTFFLHQFKPLLDWLDRIPYVLFDLQLSRYMILSFNSLFNFSQHLRVAIHHKTTHKQSVRDYSNICCGSNCGGGCGCYLCR